MKPVDFDILKTPIPKEGQVLIEASAGTGKTFALTGLVVRLILEGADLRKILVVTFTNAATDELKTRIRKALREMLEVFSNDDPPKDPFLAKFWTKFQNRDLAIGQIKDALQVMDEASVFTIHGFCSRLLEQAAFESGSAFSSEVVSEADDLLKRAMADFRHREAYDNPWVAGALADIKEDDLRTHYRNANRFPNTQIVPESRSFHEIVPEIEALIPNLRDSWSEDFADRVGEIIWKKDTPQEGLLASLPDALNDIPPASLIKAYASDQILNDANKTKSKALAQTLTEHPFARACQKIAPLLNDLTYSVIGAFVREVRAGFDGIKREAGVLTFDDLVATVYDALQPDNPSRTHLLAAIKRRWSHALIDEFQDTDPVQYTIFREAFAELPLVFVGDPKQAIYAFRGADIFVYLDAAKLADEQYNLGTNWRSTENLVEAVNQVFERLERPFINSEISYTPVKSAGQADKTPLTGDDRPPLIWWRIPSDGRPINKGVLHPMIRDAVVGEMQRLLSGEYRIGDHRVKPRNIAVIVRKNKEAQDIQDALRRAGIPSVLSKSGNLWESEEVGELRHLLRAMLRPQDVRLMVTAMSTVLWGSDAQQIYDIQQDESEVSRISAQLLQWRIAWYRHGVLYAVNRFMEELDATRRLLTINDGERRLTNLRHTLEMLHSAERERHRSPEELLTWLIDRIVDKEKSDQAELRLESDAEAVQIITSHGSKGLQYDIVFAPYLWDVRDDKNVKGYLVHDDDGGMIYDLGKSDTYKKQNRAEQLSEDLRLAYVTLTRAKYRCYVPVGHVHTAGGSALNYVFIGHEIATDESDPTHVEQAVTAAGGADASAIVAQLAAKHPDLMALEDFPEDGPPLPLADASKGILYNPREITSDMLERLIPWDVTSFTEITRLKDNDGADPPVLLSRRIKPEGFAAFAAGTQPGQALHDILEHVDFQATGAPQAQRLIQRTLGAYGLADPVAHRAEIDPEELVSDLLWKTVTTPLPLVGSTLADVPRERQIREWRFVLPVDRINGDALVEAISRHADPEIASAYPPFLRRLSGDAVNGYLSGFADLVFEKDGRWFIYDWKSTLLGDSPENYGQPQLQEAALPRHYLLQVYFYAVGLHRYLKSRIPDYNYETHFGGAAVVFLRGIDGETENGFYVQRPPFALINALDGLFKGRDASPRRPQLDVEAQADCLASGPYLSTNKRTTDRH